MSQKLHQKYSKDKANALILVVISMPLIMLLLSLNFNIGKDISTKNIFNNTVQSAAQAAVKTVDNRSVLGNAAVQTFVSTYDKLITNPESASDAYVGGGMEAEILRSRGECGVMEINGVERTLPYMEISLSENRGNSMSSNYSTETWKLDGTSRTVKERGLGNVQYKVLKATVWEATPNFFYGMGLEPCHLQKAEASAIAFGSQADLEEQVTLTNKVDEAKDRNISIEGCIANQLQSISNKMNVPPNHTIEIIKVTDPTGKSVPYTDYSKGISNPDYPLQLDSAGRALIYKMESDFNYHGSYVDIEYAYGKINSEGKKILSSSAVIRFEDNRDPSCAFVWPDLNSTWIGIENPNTRNAEMIVPDDLLDYWYDYSSSFTIDGELRNGTFTMFPIGESGFGQATWTDGTANAGKELEVEFKLKHIETGSKKTYKAKVFIHPPASGINFNYNPASGEVTKKVIGGVDPSPSIAKYFNYSLTGNSSNWLNTKLTSRDSVTTKKGASILAPGAKIDTYDYSIKAANGKIFNNVGSKTSFKITYNIPTPTISRGYYSFSTELKNNKALEWKETSNTAAEKNKYIAKFTSIYGAAGLSESVCTNTSARMFIKTVKGSKDIAISKEALKDHALIKNKTPELITALESVSGNGSNLVCYIDLR